MITAYNQLTSSEFQISLKSKFSSCIYTQSLPNFAQHHINHSFLPDTSAWLRWALLAWLVLVCFKIIKSSCFKSLSFFSFFLSFMLSMCASLCQMIDNSLKTKDFISQKKNPLPISVPFTFFTILQTFIKYLKFFIVIYNFRSVYKVTWSTLFLSTD